MAVQQNKFPTDKDTLQKFLKEFFGSERKEFGESAARARYTIRVLGFGSAVGVGLIASLLLLID